MDVLGGRVVWLTSGRQGPMRGEVAYAASKAALAGLTQTVADELIEQGVLLDTVNPGPVNTGYPETESSDRDEAAIEKVSASYPPASNGRARRSRTAHRLAELGRRSLDGRSVAQHRGRLPALAVRTRRECETHSNTGHGPGMSSRSFMP